MCVTEQVTRENQGITEEEITGNSPHAWGWVKGEKDGVIESRSLGRGLDFQEGAAQLLLASPSSEEEPVGGRSLRGRRWLAEAGVSEAYMVRLGVQFLEKLETTTTAATEVKSYCLGIVTGTRSRQGTSGGRNPSFPLGCAISLQGPLMLTPHGEKRPDHTLVLDT